MATPPHGCDEPANQRIAHAFRSHFKMLVEVLDPVEAALALYSEKLINKTVLEEATSNDLRFRRSLKVVEAVETFLGVCNSTTKAQRVLSILEKSDPTSLQGGGVIARIRRDSSADSRGNSEEEIWDYSAESPGGGGSRPKLIHMGIDKRVNSQFALLKGRYASMIMTAKRCLVKKNINISEFKERLLIQCRDISRDLLDKAGTMEVIFNDCIQSRCTVTNYFLLGSLAVELDIPEISEAIEKFEKSEKEFKTCLLEDDFATVVHEEVEERKRHRSNLPRTEIKLKVDWAKEEATLNEFQSLVRDVFSSLCRWIYLEVVNSGCVCFTCFAPERLKNVLIQIAHEQQKVAVKRKVILLVVGETVIFDMTTSPQTICPTQDTASLDDKERQWFEADMTNEKQEEDLRRATDASKMREKAISGMQGEADWRDTGVREEKSVSDSHVGVQTEQELSDSAVQTELELSDSAVQTEQELSDYSAVQTTTKQEMVPLPAGWEIGSTSDGRIFYIDHKLQQFEAEIKRLTRENEDLITKLAYCKEELKRATESSKMREKAISGMQVEAVREVSKRKNDSQLTKGHPDVDDHASSPPAKKPRTSSHPDTSGAASKVKQLEGPSDDDLPQSSGVQTDELMTASPPSATKSHKPVTVQIVRQFIDIDYQCPICLEVFNDSLTVPYLTDCGHHLCCKCCDHLLNTCKTECPTCRKPDMLNNARCDNFFQRMVKNLQVRCSDYKEGCEWVGELKDLNDHLDRQCGISCPFGCGKFTHSSEMREHTRHCHNRMISCENCGYYNTLAIVTKKHYPICPHGQSPTAITPATVSPQYLYNLAPIEFIIGDFSEKKRANEKWLSSPFYTDNKGYKFHLSVHPNGIHDGRGSHLSVQAEFMRREYNFEGDIRIELLNWRGDKNHHSAIICFNRYNHTMSHSPRHVTNHWQEVEAATRVGHPHQFISHNDLEPTSDTKYLLGDFFKLRVSVAIYSIPPLQLTPSWQRAIIMGPGGREVTPLSSHDDSTQPIIAQFTISEFSKRKQFNNIYFSPPFTTSPQGYKFSIKAFANGFSSGRGSNITMSAIIMKGQHDDHLKWPFTGTIIIEVLNWLEDKRHFKQVFSIDPNDGIVRVTKGEYGKDFGFYKFMSHASLSFNSSTNTQYLSKDCICVRVRKSRAADDML